MPNHRARTFLAGLLVVALAAACSSGDDSAAPSPTTTTPDPAVQEPLDDWIEDSPGGVAVALADSDAQLDVAAAGSTEPDAAFRVGSLSKTFVSVMILQLVDEGTVALDDPVVGYLPELAIGEGITVRHLLSHRSGLPEYTDQELAPAVVTDPAKAWMAADVLALVADQPADFPPDDRFAYSNTNYVVAGLLLERVTGRSLTANLEERIVAPLGLEETYFAPDPARSPVTGFSGVLPGGSSDATPYRALETAAGAAGALVSTAPDLATFIRALGHGELLGDATYEEMRAGFPEEGHGLGVFPADPPTATGIANAGAIPGFTAFMSYDPETEDLLVVLASDDSLDPSELYDLG